MPQPPMKVADFVAIESVTLPPTFSSGDQSLAVQIGRDRPFACHKQVRGLFRNLSGPLTKMLRRLF